MPGEENWLDQLPEQLRQAPFIAKAESLDDAMGKLTHAAKLVGSSVRIPGEDANEDDRKAFYDKLADVPGVTVLPDLEDAEGQTSLFRKLGAPEKGDGYELPKIDDGFEWNENIANDLREFAAEAGMTKAQFTRFAEKIGQQEHQSGLEAQEEKQQAQKQIKEEWGADYDNREALIRGWMDKSEAPESMRTLLDEGNLSPDAMKWLHAVAKNFEGDVSPMNRDNRGGQNDQVTPAEAKDKLAELRSSDAYWDNSHPLHREYVQRVVHYTRLASGQNAA